jgi:predicted small lipoprotein YifL
MMRPLAFAAAAALTVSLAACGDRNDTVETPPADTMAPVDPMTPAPPADGMAPVAPADGSMPSTTPPVDPSAPVAPDATAPAVGGEPVNP